MALRGTVIYCKDYIPSILVLSHLLLQKESHATSLAQLLAVSPSVVLLLVPRTIKRVECRPEWPLWSTTAHRQAVQEGLVLHLGGGCGARELPVRQRRSSARGAHKGCRTHHTSVTERLIPGMQYPAEGVSSGVVLRTEKVLMTTPFELMFQ